MLTMLVNLPHLFLFSFHCVIISASVAWTGGLCSLFSVGRHMLDYVASSASPCDKDMLHGVGEAVVCEHLCVTRGV